MSLLSNEHISQQDLLRYVEDDCSRTEMRDIDRHLATCPMCSDAVEGLMLLSEPSVAVAQLDKRIEGKIAEKIVEQPIGTPVDLPVEKTILQVVKRPFWQQRWAAAAAVLLLASGSIWVYKNAGKAEKQASASAEIQAEPNAELSNNAVAITLDSLNQTPQYAEAKETKKDEIVVDLRPSNEISNTAVAPIQQKGRKKTTNTANGQTLQKTDITSTDIATISDKIDAEKNLPQATTASAPAAYSTQTEKTRENVEVPAQKAPQTAYSMSSKAKTKEVKSEDVDNESKQAVQKSRDAIVVGSTRAKKTMPAAAKSTPSVSTASEPILSRADDHFNNKNYQAALAEYAQFVAQETEGEKHEYALFQLANCYLKLNKKADAKVLFEKVSGTNGQYQRAAKKALKDL